MKNKICSKAGVFFLKRKETPLIVQTTQKQQLKFVDFYAKYYKKHSYRAGFVICNILEKGGIVYYVY